MGAAAARSKVTTKGQVTIPRQVRDRLGLQPGDEIEFVEDHGVFRIRRYFAESPFEKWIGCLKEFEGRSSDELVEEMRGR